MPKIRRWLRLTDHSQLMNYKTPIAINHLGTIKNFIRYFILHNYFAANDHLDLPVLLKYHRPLAMSHQNVLLKFIVRYNIFISCTIYQLFNNTRYEGGGGSFKNTRNHTTMQIIRNFWHSLQGKQQMTDYSHSEYSLHYSSDYSLELFRYN